MRKPFSKWADCGYCGDKKVIPPDAGQRLMPGKNVTVVRLTDGQRLIAGHTCSIPLVEPRRSKSGVTVDELLSGMGIENVLPHHELLAQLALHGKTEGARLRALSRLQGPPPRATISIEIRSPEIKQALEDRINGIQHEPEPKVQKGIEEPPEWVEDVLQTKVKAEPPVPVQPEPGSRNWEDAAPWTRQVLGPRAPVWNAERKKAYRGSPAEALYGPAPWNPWNKLAKMRH